MKWGFLVFMLLPIVGHVYVMWHIFRLIPIAIPLRWLLVLLLTGFFFGLFAGFGGLYDRFPLWAATATYEVTTSWVFILLYLFMLFLLLDLGRLVHLVPSSLLKNSWPGTAFVTVVMVAVFAFGNWKYNQKVRVPLHLTTQKAIGHPLRLVMLSDMHLGYHNRRHELARWIDLIRAEKPDLVLIAGDIIDKSMRPLIEEGCAEELKRLGVPVVACLGNHEKFAGEASAIRFFRDAGITLLRDSVLDWGPLKIVGRDDRSNPRRKPLAKLLSTTEGHAHETDSTSSGEKYIIVLDHQPYRLDEAERAGVDFQLSGHTHRGQVWPISWITDALYECSWGMWQRGNTHFYISSGLGIWGGKFRIGTQSEYVVATLDALPAKQ